MVQQCRFHASDVPASDVPAPDVPAPDVPAPGGPPSTHRVRLAFVLVGWLSRLATPTPPHPAGSRRRLHAEPVIVGSVVMATVAKGGHHGSPGELARLLDAAEGLSGPGGIGAGVPAPTEWADDTTTVANYRERLHSGTAS